MRRILLLTILCATIMAGAVAAENKWYQLPELPPPPQYGNILIHRAGATYELPAVTFSHWKHRLYYTCRVCHFELEFEMKANATEITEEQNRNGEFCGACHNGEIAFAHSEENCSNCHNGDIKYGEKDFKKVYRRLPKDKYGNRVDWTAAYRRGMIRPKQSIFDDNYSSMPFKKFLTLEAEMSIIPPAVFPHGVHTDWLDCANCHPGVFNIKKKTTKHFSMDSILKGEFCGACHLNVAFPLDDCKRCHPKIWENK